MKCPRCVQKVAPGAASCPHCGYSMEDACGFYGRESVVAERLMDVEGMLGEKERADCLEWIGAFGRRFPQLFLLVYLGPLPPPASPRQFAFWLLNHAAVPEAEALQPNERGLLLVVNPKAGSAVLTGGYFIENLLSQSELDGVLRSGAREFGRGEWAAGLGTVVTGLSDILKKKAKEAGRHPERFQAPVPAEWSGMHGFPPLVRTGEGTGKEFPEKEEAAGFAPDRNAVSVMESRASGGWMDGDSRLDSNAEALAGALRKRSGGTNAEMDSRGRGGDEDETDSKGAGKIEGEGRDVDVDVEGAKGKKSGAGAPGRTTRVVRALSGGKRNNPKRR